MSDWIQTFTGRKIRPLDPDSADICIEDIAHALSLQCRFTGHVKEFYSVAQHSYYVSQHCDPADAKWGLLHDAAEAYLMDLARPVKHDPRMAFFKEAERKLDSVIAAKFGLSLPIPESVHMADRRLLLTERRDLMLPLEWPETDKKIWPVNATPFDWPIWPWTPKFAEHHFLEKFKELDKWKSR